MVKLIKDKLSIDIYQNDINLKINIVYKELSKNYI